MSWNLGSRVSCVGQFTAQVFQRRELCHSLRSCETGNNISVVHELRVLYYTVSLPALCFQMIPVPCLCLVNCLRNSTSRGDVVTMFSEAWPVHLRTVFADVVVAFWCV